MDWVSVGTGAGNAFTIIADVGARNPDLLLLNILLPAVSSFKQPKKRNFRFTAAAVVQYSMWCCELAVRAAIR